MNKKLFSTDMIIKVAILAALSAVLLIFNFPIPLAPSFYKIDFADVAGLIGGFAMGPFAAFMIQVIKIILNIIIEGGSQTAFIGELSNFLISSSLCVTAAAIYHKDHTLKGAIRALILGSVFMVLVAAVLNYLLIIPAYVKFMHFPLDAIVSMGTKIIPLVKDKLTLILFCTVPFNLIKALMVSLITFVVYKRISPLLKPRA